MTRVYLETGRTWVFACALDWPGWARRGKGEEAALDALLDYRDRYADVVSEVFEPTQLRVVGRVAGTMTTDFGAPDALGEWDEEPLPPAEAARFAALLEQAWAYFDRVVDGAPAELRKGPRGRGRDRDAIRDHVREAERGKAGKLGSRIAPRTPWADQRAALSAVVRSGASGGAWPVRYGCRRLAWHVLDHAFEIEDKSG